MKNILRLLLAVAVSVWLALPSSSSDGGENAGGTGVWVLPRASFLAGCGSMPRESKVLLGTTQDLVVEVSIEVGSFVATFLDEVTGLPVSLQSYGPRVRIPAALLQAVVASNHKAHIVISDANQFGYMLHIEVHPSTGAISVQVM
jgi:hypothetical protein